MKYNITPESTNRASVDLGHSHVTTLDFNQILPILCTECIIGDKHNVSLSNFTRLAPMVYPTYGRFSLRYASFFVPSYQLFDDFESFITGQDKGGRSIRIPTLDRVSFVTAWTNSRYSTQVNYDTTSPTHHDFAYFPSSATSSTSPSSYRFTSVGRYLYKIMQMLGYSLPSGLDLRQNSLYMTSPKLNALPLLAFLKAFNDWMSISPAYNNGPITSFLESVRHSTTPQSLQLNQILNLIADNVHPLIGSDLFTSSFDLRNNPAVGSPSVDSGLDLYNQLPQNGIATPLGTSTFQRSADGNYFQTSTGTNGEVRFTAEQMRYLTAFDKFIRRNNLAGSKPAQRIFARFGLKSEDFRSNYAHFIDSTSIDFNVGDVTATAANTDPALGLGTYAGQSVGSGKFDFNYESQDYGYLLVFAFIDVRSSYKNTINPSVLRSAYSDFYQPEFDGIGMSPLSFSSLTNNPRRYLSKSSGSVNGIPENQTDQVFGYVPRYEDYRTCIDKVSGDFVIIDTLDGWHFARNFDDLRNSNNALSFTPQSNAFQFAGSQYDRIFQSGLSDTDGFGPYDHFFATFEINHKAIRPMLSRAGSIGMQDGALAIDSFGKTLQSM